MRKRGVITVYTAISLALVISLFLALLEAARVTSMMTMYEEHIDLAAENVMAHYNRKVFKESGLFVRKYTDELKSEMNEYLNRDEKEDERDLLRGKECEVTELNYRLMTDDGGKVYRKMAASYLTSAIPNGYRDKLEEISNNYLVAKEYIDGIEIGKLMEKAINAVMAAIEYAQSHLYKKTTDANGNEVVEVDPAMQAALDALNSSEIMDYPSKKASIGIKLVVPDGFKISTGRKLLYKPLMERSLNAGNMEPVESNDVESTLQVIYALLNTKSAVEYSKAEKNSGKAGTSVEKDDNLNYELEYILCGAHTDYDNLDKTIKRLLIFREGVRYLSNLSNPYTVARAQAIATALVSFTGIPALIPLVKHGLLICWAFVEAADDCKILLGGHRVPLLPLPQIGITLDLNYREHIGIMMLPMESKKISFRSMDILEEKTGVKADSLICAISGKVDVKTLPRISKAILMFKVPDFMLERSYEFLKQTY
ncbi:MAG: hypothetical protein IJM91_02810 [Lachnospiraceae bacterium]|nr:hypothetical protein [Lachnospiraceae bacterium]